MKKMKYSPIIFSQTKDSAFHKIYQKKMKRLIVFKKFVLLKHKYLT